MLNLNYSGISRDINKIRPQYSLQPRTLHCSFSKVWLSEGNIPTLLMVIDNTDDKYRKSSLGIHMIVCAVSGWLLRIFSQNSSYENFFENWSSCESRWTNNIMNWVNFHWEEIGHQKPHHSASPISREQDSAFSFLSKNTIHYVGIRSDFLSMVKCTALILTAFYKHLETIALMYSLSRKS